MKSTIEQNLPMSLHVSGVLNDAERQRCEVWTRVMGYHRPATSA